MINSTYNAEIKNAKKINRQEKEASKEARFFSQHVLGITLYPYQLEAAEAIIKSVYERDGKTFVIIFSRQSGKDELFANIFLFLLARFYDWGCDIVCAQPTFKPQTINAMERLRKRGTVLGRNLSRTAGYIIRMGQARISYFSGEPAANQVGATADRLLVMNEAQDIETAIYDKRFAPMAASGNATRVFSGTSWTSDTLLAREKRFALEAERKDGQKRVFIVDCDKVSKSNKWYARYVKQEIEKLGRQHPLVKTQYFCEEIDAQVGMFNAGRRALMIGDQPAQPEPIEGHLYAFCVDAAGMDEALLNLDGMGNPGRDSTTLSIVDIDMSNFETLRAPTYRVINRMDWKGVSHMQIFGALTSLAAIWQPSYIVQDATGVGEGLWAMLDKAFPTRVIPVKFSQQAKSELGWQFIAMIETGRFHDCSGNNDIVREQYDKCQSEVLIGPAKTIRWGVKDGTRGASGELVHDDYIMADALCAKLDELDWMIGSETLVVLPKDIFKGLGRIS